MKIKYTHHALKKFSDLRLLGFRVTRSNIARVLKNPLHIDTFTDYPNKVVSGEIDETHILRVVCDLIDLYLLSATLLLMKDRALPTRLPSSFYKFFWDVDAKKVNPSTHPYYVINRLLDKGDLKAVKWVRKNFPKRLIAETIKTRRDFSFSTVTFWARYLDIPLEEVKCMQEPYLSMHKMHWPS